MATGYIFLCEQTKELVFLNQSENYSWAPETSNMEVWKQLTIVAKFAISFVTLFRVGFFARSLRISGHC